MLKFKQRKETKQICVATKNVKNESKEILFMKARRKGELDTGYHVILHNNGDIEYDRDIGAVAQYDFEDNETSIYILADTLGKKKLSDAQRSVLSDFAEYHQLPLKYIEV